VLTGALARRLGADRAAAAGLAIGTGLGATLIGVADPHAGRYPACPSAALLGVDCPACGTLRGLHDLSRGRVVDALDHNLLLLIAVPLGVWVWWRWVRAALGRPVPAVRAPVWAVPVAVVGALAFTVVRNLPYDAVAWLGAS
jgi:hypothetical protein